MKEQPLPSNMVLTWGQGTKSYADILIHTRGKGDQSIIEWREAEPPAQMDEAIYSLLFHKALALASKSPTKVVHYIRQDMDYMPQTPNNKPFNKADNWIKTINYEGYIYRRDFCEMDKYIPPEETSTSNQQLSGKELKQRRNERRREKKHK